VRTVVKYEVNALPKQCAIDYVLRLKERIINQSFSYPALNKDYTKWKDEHYPSAKTFWHLGGDLVKAITVLPLGKNTWAGTIQGGVQDSGGKSYFRDSSTEILKYALILESGYKGLKYTIPARPLFVPTGETYITLDYPTRLLETKRNIMRKWVLK